MLPGTQEPVCWKKKGRRGKLMRLFDKLMKKANLDIQAEEGKVYAPISGNYILLKDIADGVFSSGVLGEGCGIEPTEGKVYAPIDGTVATIADTKHAIGLIGPKGEELLIHVGMDTVDMNGKGFTVKTAVDARIKAGQLLLEFDMDEIKKAGHPVVTAFVMANSSDHPDFRIVTGKTYQAGEAVGIL